MLTHVDSGKERERKRGNWRLGRLYQRAMSSFNHFRKEATLARAHEAMGHVRPTAVVNFLQLLAARKYRSELYGFMWIMNPDLQGLQFGSAGKQQGSLNQPGV